MTSSLATVSYLGATILFILCLGGLSNQETARRGNLFGIVGMAIAVVATILGPQVTAGGLPYILGAMVVGELGRHEGRHQARRPIMGVDDVGAIAAFG